MSTKNIPVHPLVALREKHKEELVEMTGYVGVKTDSFLHFYPDLTSGGYYEIPAKAVLHHELCCKDCGNEGKVNLYVPASTEMRWIEPLKAADSRRYWFSPFKQPAELPPKYPNIDIRVSPTVTPIQGGHLQVMACIQNCINHVLNNRDQYVVAMCNTSTGTWLETPTMAARRYLENCLSQCGVRGSQLETLIDQTMSSLIKDTKRPCNPVDDDFNPYPFFGNK